MIFPLSSFNALPSSRIDCVVNWPVGIYILGFPEVSTEESRLLFKIEPSFVDGQGVSIDISLVRWHLAIRPLIPILPCLFLEELFELFHGRFKLAPWSHQKINVGCAYTAKLGISRVGVGLSDRFKDLCDVSIGFPIHRYQTPLILDSLSIGTSLCSWRGVSMCGTG